MAKKRGNNEGTVFHQPNGKWRAQISLQGRRLSKVHQTQKQCQDWIRDTKQKIEVGMTYDASQITVEKFLSEWLIIKDTEVRKKTIRQYRYLAERYLIPAIGKTILVNLNPPEIQNMYHKYLEEGKGKRTVQVMHAVLRCCLNHAVRLGVINRNPTVAVIPPKTTPKEIQVLDANQIQTMLLISKEHQPEYHALYLLALTTGMRLGELLGLRWEDLDWEKKTLSIKRQLQRDPGKGFIFTAPKTKAGLRAVTLGKNTLEVLKLHSSEYSAYHHPLIFSFLDGSPLGERKVQKAFKSLLELAGLPKLRFHDLRHTSATQMLTNGIDVLSVSRRLGHAKTSITLDIYAHSIPGLQDDAAALMDEITTPIALPLELVAHGLPTNANFEPGSEDDFNQK